MTKRARVRPNLVQSQYGESRDLLDGFILVIEGGERIRFETKEAAKDYARAQGYKLAYSGGD